MALRPAHPDDISDVLALSQLSLDGHVQAQFTHPFRYEYPAEFLLAMDNVVRKKLAETGPKGYNLVIEDPESGKIVGWAFWRRNAGQEYETKVEKYKRITAGDDDENSNKNEQSGVAQNKAASIPRMLLANKCAINDTLNYFSSPHWYLSQLIVHPSQKRKGHGSVLTLWGMQKGREEGLPCYLSASPEGEKLYGRLGWREVGQRTSPMLEDMSEEDMKVEEKAFGMEALKEQFDVKTQKIMKWGDKERDFEIFKTYEDILTIKTA
ncbi:hypothetical protein ABW20_dc0108023 [Dactylellina cionopaga]|nr:hypothetical protein ABW20_dc0108023 [Dactylellina cionopaga]